MNGRLHEQERPEESVDPDLATCEGRVVRRDGAGESLLTLALTSSTRTSYSLASSPSDEARTTCSAETLGASGSAVFGVSMYPTCTPMTWVAGGASSTRNEFVAEHNAAFDALSEGVPRGYE
ncbi:hypothetical protein GU243_08530 [Pseudarthrobacter psychrotolerans]|uniref:Uncharacterized protein n=1 Tax=Pseudarthrobacter psychrotolerans TaxID=2697569 RepID=A0A6P1NLS8_9MICC|nr:hypothetical protein [Pseudarthrobacter psychrotolerans]QHK19767.1 hypothetical protein GU243_08530 [Pseudarthrobacter psychrotolerans]